jgi:hypothetical protein
MMRKYFSILTILLVLISWGSFKVGTAEAATETENNDSFSTSNQLLFTPNPYEPGVQTSWVTGDLDDEWDDDYYRISLPNPGKVTVKITPKQSTGFQVVLYNSSQSTMEDWYTYYSGDTEPQELFSNGLNSGTYFIRVDHYNGNGDNVPYKLEIDYTPSQNYEKEVNDIRSQATWIKTNQIYHGYADSYSDDYFAFTLDKSGEVKINMNRDPGTRYEINLYDSAGSEMEGWYTHYSDEKGLLNAIHTGLAAGTYYLKIEVYDGDQYNIPYSFSVNFTPNSLFETEGNDGESTADLLGIGQSFGGTISYSYDDDYYRVNVTKNSELAFYLTHPAATLFRVKVYDQRYNTYKEVVTTYGTGSLKRLFNLSLAPSTYFIKIDYYDGQDNKVPYSFKLLERDATPPAAPKVNAYTDKSTYLAGTAEANATINIRLGSKIIKTGKAGKDGKFSIALSKMTGGSTLYVTAKDSEGNESKPTVIIVKDTTAPKNPTVYEVRDYDKAVRGKSEAYAKVTVKIGSTTLGYKTADKYGNFSVYVKSARKAGTVLSVTSTDKAGNISAVTKVKVKDKTAPGIPAVNKVTARSVYVTGKAEANSTVYVKAGSRVIGYAKANKSGSYSVKIVKQKAGAALYVYAKDQAGNYGKSKKVIVQR